VVVGVACRMTKVVFSDIGTSIPHRWKSPWTRVWISRDRRGVWDSENDGGGMCPICSVFVIRRGMI